MPKNIIAASYVLPILNTQKNNAGKNLDENILGKQVYFNFYINFQLKSLQFFSVIALFFKKYPLVFFLILKF